MEIKILGVCSDPDKADKSFVDFVTTKEFVKDFECDYIIDLNNIKIIKDPRPYIKHIYDVVYSDFIDRNGILRLSGDKPNLFGFLIKREVYMRHPLGVNVADVVMHQYVPTSLIRII